MLLMNKVDFTEWLESVLLERRMSRAELARASGISAPHISRIMNGEQSPGVDAITAIARAIDKSPEEVFRRVAGITTPEPQYVPFLDEWNNVFHDLGDIDREELLEIARLKASRRERGKLATQSTQKKPSRNKKPARIG